MGAQIAVGYTMEADGAFEEAECDPAGEDRSGGDTSDAEEDRIDRLEEDCEAEQDRLGEAAEDGVGTAWSELGGGELFEAGLSLPELHVLLGLSILVLATARVLWRRTGQLPPWDPRLTVTDQRIVHATEVALMALLFVVPASGIALVLGEDGLLPLHIAAHIAFFVALGAHLVMVLGKRLLPRML